MNLTADTDNKEISGKIVSGDRPIKINIDEITATVNKAITSKKSLGDDDIK